MSDELTDKAIGVMHEQGEELIRLRAALQKAEDGWTVELLRASGDVGRAEAAIAEADMLRLKNADLSAGLERIRTARNAFGQRDPAVVIVEMSDHLGIIIHEQHEQIAAALDRERQWQLRSEAALALLGRWQAWYLDEGYSEPSPAHGLVNESAAMLKDWAPGQAVVPEPRLSDLRGIAPNATGGLSSEEFVRRNRNEWDTGQAAE